MLSFFCGPRVLWAAGPLGRGSSEPALAYSSIHLSFQRYLPCCSLACSSCCYAERKDGLNLDLSTPFFCCFLFGRMLLSTPFFSCFLFGRVLLSCPHFSYFLFGRVLLAHISSHLNLDLLIMIRRRITTRAIGGLVGK